MKNFILGVFDDSDPFEGSSDGISNFKKENFQLTHDEAIQDQRIQIEFLDEFKLDNSPEIKMIVIDGELRTINELDLPPSAICISPDSSLLSIRA